MATTRAREVTLLLKVTFTEEERRCVRAQASRKKGLATKKECRAWAAMALRADMDVIDDGGNAETP